MLFLFQGDLFWNVAGLLIFVSLSFSHYIPFPLTTLLNHCSVYQNFRCQKKFYWALGFDYMVFLFCNDKCEKSLDWSIVVITVRAHCFHDCYILRPSCFCEIWALCVSWITYDACGKSPSRVSGYMELNENMCVLIFPFFLL